MNKLMHKLINKRHLLNPLPQADIDMLNERIISSHHITYKRKHYLPEGKPRYDDQVDNGEILNLNKEK